MTFEVRPGDTIEVEINKKKFMTFIDSKGVQRLKSSELVANLISESWQKGLTSNLDKILDEYKNGAYSTEDIIDLYNASQQSLTDLSNVDFRDEVEIYNPLWLLAPLQKVSVNTITEMFKLLGYRRTKARNFVLDYTYSGKIGVGNGIYIVPNSLPIELAVTLFFVDAKKNIPKSIALLRSQEMSEELVDLVDRIEENYNLNLK